MERDPQELPGMRRNPWILKPPDGGADFKAYRDTSLDPAAIVILTGAREVRYRLRCLDDLYEMLKERGGWVHLGAVGEHEQTAPGSVEAWARSTENPVGGWYGLKSGARGEFATFIPPIMRTLNLAELDDSPQGIRMRAV
jgi:hypothetical protein